MTAIGILYPGELGRAFAQVLLEQQACQISTTAEGRPSGRTAPVNDGIKSLDTLRDVVQMSDVVISVVPPHVAMNMARRIREVWSPSANMQFFVDANSISPMTMRGIAALFEGTSVQIIDAAVHGQATRLRESATLYLSGLGTDRISQFFVRAMRVRNVGSEPGLASLQKMLLGSISKGMIALYCQALMAAQTADVADRFCEELGHFYPELQAFVGRSLPTYLKHALRRSEEMAELAETLESFQVDPELARRVGKLFAKLNEGDFSQLLRNGNSRPNHLSTELTAPTQSARQDAK